MRLLAEIAKQQVYAMAVGSQHAGLRNEQLADTYKIVSTKTSQWYNFANIGADVPIDLLEKQLTWLKQMHYKSILKCSTRTCDV